MIPLLYLYTKYETTSASGYLRLALRQKNGWFKDRVSAYGKKFWTLIKQGFKTSFFFTTFNVLSDHCCRFLPFFALVASVRLQHASQKQLRSQTNVIRELKPANNMLRCCLSQKKTKNAVHLHHTQKNKYLCVLYNQLTTSVNNVLTTY